MKHIDKVFSEGLSNHKVEVPDGLWEKVAPIAEKNSKRALLWFWLAGILALIIGGYIFYQYTTTEDSVDPTTLAVKEDFTNKNQFSSTLSIGEVVNNTTAAKETYPIKKQVKSASKVRPITNPTIESKSKTQKINFDAKPADLVITKSYQNGNNAVVTKSLASSNSEDYNVILNSNSGKVNAGSLLRIVEPLAEITLPAFEKVLKKKLLTSQS